MYPVIFKIGPFTIYSYGLVLAAAFLVGLCLVKPQAKRQNIDPELIVNLSFIAFIFGLLGARLFYVIENLNYYLKYPQEIIMLQHGGLSWFGGLISGTLSSIIYLKKKQLVVYKILDLVMPFVALAQAIGRIGCLLNGCCFGKQSASGLYFPVHQAILIPTQLYSSLGLTLIFIILRLKQDKSRRDGEIFYTYLFLYSIARFFIEFWRAEHAVIFFGLTFFQIISAVIFGFSLLKVILIQKNKN